MGSVCMGRFLSRANLSFVIWTKSMLVCDLINDLVLLGLAFSIVFLPIFLILIVVVNTVV